MYKWSSDHSFLKRNELGFEIDGLSTDQIVEKLNILRKAKSEASNPKNQIKKAIKTKDSLILKIVRLQNKLTTLPKINFSLFYILKPWIHLFKMNPRLLLLWLDTVF